jgi:hypothetical protein
VKRIFSDPNNQEGNMKKSILLLSISCVVLLAVSAGTAPRMVLLSYFSNWRCGPCYTADPYFDRICDSTHVNTTAAIHYHTWWPAPPDDPFYQYNITENTARTNYYQPGSKYVPRLFIDGLIDGGSSYSSWASLTTSRAAVSSPLTIDIDGNFDSGTMTGDVNALVTAESSVSATNLVIHFVLTETDMYLPGPNGVD